MNSCTFVFVAILFFFLLSCGQRRANEINIAIVYGTVYGLDELISNEKPQSVDYALINMKVIQIEIISHRSIVFLENVRNGRSIFSL